MSIKLKSIQISNIRGFSSASLNLDNDTIVLVGSNNAGKSALLLILNWIFNDLNLDNLYQDNLATEEDWTVLQPARETRNQARRINLNIEFSDGRTARSYSAEKNCVDLRIDFKQSPKNKIVVKIGKPSRGDTEKNEIKAIRLIERIRSEYSFHYIPAFRDAASNNFKKSLITAFEEKLSEGAIHQKQAGSKWEYREVKKAKEALTSVTDALLEPFLKDLKKEVPPGLLENANALINLDHSEIVKWLAQNINLQLSTGDHDINCVNSTQVGSGLQSLLVLALSRTKDNEAKKRILALDEPEAFLHPSAQRTLARLVAKNSHDNGEKLIITTHSPIIVEEFDFKNINIVSNHKFYMPTTTEQKRNEINTYFLSGMGAEMLFSKSILLVEGESDRLFFENIRRKLSKYDLSGNIDQLSVVSVGGSKRFCPWVKLLQSYKTNGNESYFNYLCIYDADVIGDARESIKETYGSVPHAIFDQLQTTKNHFESGKLTHQTQEWHHHTNISNQLLGVMNIPFRFLEGDLEYSILKNTSTSTYGKIKKELNLDITKEHFIKNLGSKGIDCIAKSEAEKAPWVRNKIADIISFKDLSENMKEIFDKWINGALSNKEKQALYKRAKWN